MVWLALALVGCATSTTVEPLGDDAVCDVLFGLPNDNSGLDEQECQPQIVSDGEVVWQAPVYTEADLAALGALTLLDTLQALPEDPYLTPDVFQPRPTRVCAVHLDGAGGYTLTTHAGVEQARISGGRITHGGGCGLCSTLEDFVVYAGTGDLTQPVRQCGLETFNDGHEANVACLEDIGFTPPCADIWARNTAHTRAECLSDCIALLDEPYHTSSGAPNACIACDEAQSGPVFKAVAGRTRRNSGLPTALCRECGSVWRVDQHDVLALP